MLLASRQAARQPSTVQNLPILILNIFFFFVLLRPGFAGLCVEIRMLQSPTDRSGGSPFWLHLHEKTFNFIREIPPFSRHDAYCKTEYEVKWGLEKGAKVKISAKIDHFFRSVGIFLSRQKRTKANIRIAMHAFISTSLTPNH